jgi:hypothetical protein
MNPRPFGQSQVGAAFPSVPGAIGSGQSDGRWDGRGRSPCRGDGRVGSVERARMIIVFLFFLYLCKGSSYPRDLRTARRRISCVVVGGEADDRFPLFPLAKYPLGMNGFHRDQVNK